MGLNSKRQATYNRIWTNPPRQDIEFDEVEKLMVGLGCKVKQGAGSRISFVLGAHRLKMHQPHKKSGKPTLKIYQIEDIRAFLVKAGQNIYGDEADEELD